MKLVGRFCSAIAAGVLVTIGGLTIEGTAQAGTALFSILFCGQTKEYGGVCERNRTVLFFKNVI